MAELAAASGPAPALVDGPALGRLIALLLPVALLGGASRLFGPLAGVIPLVILFEMSIWLSVYMERRWNRSWDEDFAEVT